MKARILSFLEVLFLCLTCTVSLFRWLLLVHYTMPRHVCKYYEETAILWRFLLNATETFIISRKIARYSCLLGKWVTLALAKKKKIIIFLFVLLAATAGEWVVENKGVKEEGAKGSLVTPG